MWEECWRYPMFSCSYTLSLSGFCSLLARNTGLDGVHFAFSQDGSSSCPIGQEHRFFMGLPNQLLQRLIHINLQLACNWDFFFLNLQMSFLGALHLQNICLCANVYYAIPCKHSLVCFGWQCLVRAVCNLTHTNDLLWMSLHDSMLLWLYLSPWSQLIFSMQFSSLHFM